MHSECPRVYKSKYISVSMPPYVDQVQCVMDNAKQGPKILWSTYASCKAISDTSSALELIKVRRETRRKGVSVY